MPKWMLYTAEAAPVAIVMAFLLLIAANSQVSQFKPKNTFNWATDEHFEHDGLTTYNLPPMLERLSGTKFNKAIDHISVSVPSDILVRRRTMRAHFRTTVNLRIDNFEEKDLPAQIAALREGGFSMLVNYAIINDK